jgi:hypothetical protein
MDGGSVLSLADAEAAMPHPIAGAASWEVHENGRTSAADDDAGQATFETTACYKPPKVTEVWRRRVARSCKTQGIERSVDGDDGRCPNTSSIGKDDRAGGVEQSSRVRYASAQKVSPNSRRLRARTM